MEEVCKVKLLSLKCHRLSTSGDPRKRIKAVQMCDNLLSLDDKQVWLGKIFRVSQTYLVNHTKNTV